MNDPRAPADLTRRRQLAALLWATRRQRKREAALTAALVDDLVDLRVALHQATAWGTGPLLPEQ